MRTVGEEIHAFAAEIWPLNRSITGAGTRETLSAIQRRLPSLSICEVPSGTRVFDWTVPQEWLVREAYILDPNGKKICDFSESNLNLVGYSRPFFGQCSLEELQQHLYSLTNQPSAVPYVTSYYKDAWGFCISERDRKGLKNGI